MIYKVTKATVGESDTTDRTSRSKPIRPSSCLSVRGVTHAPRATPYACYDIECPITDWLSLRGSSSELGDARKHLKRHFERFSR